jgi:hypothetical protein
VKLAKLRCNQRRELRLQFLGIFKVVSRYFQEIMQMLSKK